MLCNLRGAKSHTYFSSPVTEAFRSCQRKAEITGYSLKLFYGLTYEFVDSPEEKALLHTSINDRMNDKSQAERVHAIPWDAITISITVPEYQPG